MITVEIPKNDYIEINYVDKAVEAVVKGFSNGAMSIDVDGQIARLNDKELYEISDAFIAKGYFIRYTHDTGILRRITINKKK